MNIPFLSRLLRRPTPAPPLTPVQHWLAALRSGAYHQGRWRLCSLPQNGEPAKWCCLGVACDVYERVTGEQLEKTESGGRRYYHDGSPEVSDGERATILPPKVRNWLRLTARHASFDGRKVAGHYANSLTGVNDNTSLDFPAIAALIESEPSGLFVN